MIFKIITIGLLILLIFFAGCIEQNHTPDVKIDSKIFNDELTITLTAKQDYNNLRLDVQSEKLTIAELMSIGIKISDSNTISRLQIQGMKEGKK